MGWLLFLYVCGSRKKNHLPLRKEITLTKHLEVYEKNGVLIFPNELVSVSSLSERKRKEGKEAFNVTACVALLPGALVAACVALLPGTVFAACVALLAAYPGIVATILFIAIFSTIVHYFSYFNSQVDYFFDPKSFRTFSFFLIVFCNSNCTVHFAMHIDAVAVAVIVSSQLAIRKRTMRAPVI